MDKPIDCVICLEKLENEPCLECGHWIHLECVKKHFKPECPLCRKPLNIKVEGIPPCEVFPFDIQFDIIHETIETNTYYFYNIDGDMSEIIFQYSENETDEETDEENIHGDNWNYEDI